VALTPRDPTALTAEADAVSMPGSPTFRRYLSVAQFAQRFGAGAAEINAVRHVLQAQGLQVGAPSANRLSLPETP
jgi:subtilase family serine protease